MNFVLRKNKDVVLKVCAASIEISDGPKKPSTVNAAGRVGRLI